MTREDAITNLGEGDGRKLVAVHQHFHGDIEGRALLIFPETKSMELVRASSVAICHSKNLWSSSRKRWRRLATSFSTLAWERSPTTCNTAADLAARSRVWPRSRVLQLAPPPNVADGVLFIYINFSRPGARHHGLHRDAPGFTVVDHAQRMLGRFIERVGESGIVTRPHVS